MKMSNMFRSLSYAKLFVSQKKSKVSKRLDIILKTSFRYEKYRTYFKCKSFKNQKYIRRTCNLEKININHTVCYYTRQSRAMLCNLNDFGMHNPNTL